MHRQSFKTANAADNYGNHSCKVYASIDFVVEEVVVVDFTILMLLFILRSYKQK